MTIEMEVSSGTHVQRAFINACEMATSKNAIVQFDFNDVRSFVRPNSDPKTEFELYLAGVTYERSKGALSYDINPAYHPFDASELAVHRANREQRVVKITHRGASVEVFPGEDDDAVHERLMEAFHSNSEQAILAAMAEAKPALKDEEGQIRELYEDGKKPPREASILDPIGSEGTPELKRIFDELQRYMRNDIPMTDLPRGLGQGGVALAMLFKHEVIGLEKPPEPDPPKDYPNIEDLLRWFEMRIDGFLVFRFMKDSNFYWAEWYDGSEKTGDNYGSTHADPRMALLGLWEAINAPQT